MPKDTASENAFHSYLAGHISLAGFLDLLPDESERGFDLLMTQLLEARADVHAELEEILASGEADDRSFAAFYGLCIYYRRMKEMSKLDLLIAINRLRFDSRPMFNHVLCLSLKVRGGSENLQEAVLRSRMAVDKIQDNAGVVHAYADIVATAFEEQAEADETYLAEGVEAARKAITLDPSYAKYYCTFGRLLALKGDYSGARRLIRKAIDMEDSEKEDYALRIGDYQDHLSRITANQHAEDLRRTLVETKAEVESLVKGAVTRNLEFLGFFAALVSFTIASVQLLNQQPFDDAIKLILVLTGGLLCAFSGFGILLHGKEYTSRAVVVFSLGLLFILLVIVVIPVVE